MSVPPIPPGAPARISTIPGLDQMLQNENWQILAGVRGDPGELTGFGTASTAGQRTSRIQFIPSWSTSHVRIVYANYCGANLLGENPGAVTHKIKAALEYSTIGTETSETGVRMMAYFAGRREGVVNPWDVIISDPVEFQAVAGVPMFARQRLQVPGSGYGVPTPCWVLGGSGIGASNNGEGYFTGTDTVDVGTINQAGATNAYAPIALLGYSPNKIPTLGVMGDSIVSGSFDGGLLGNGGGWGLRIALNQTGALTYQYPVTPSFPHVRVARGGEKAADWVVWNQSQTRTRIAMMASTIICNYGTNDDNVGTSLATTQANLIAIAGQFLRRGRRFIQATILPRTTSTDSWTTTTNQTAATGESVRLLLNTWLRDPSAAGFVQRASAAAGAYGQCFVFDAAAVVECNAAGTPTLNGGYWLPNTTTATLTGACTSGSTSVLINDTNLSLTQDQYRGSLLRMTSGTQNNLQAVIYGNSATAFSLTGALTGSPSAADTFSIYSSGYTVDGTHPSSLAHQAISAAFPTSLVI